MPKSNPFEQDLDRNPANYAPLTPLQFLERHHARISSFHLKDRTLPQHCSLTVPFGRGDGQIAEILQLMRKRGWTFPASIELEYPVPADSAQAIREHHKKYGYSLPFVRDVDQRLVKLTGATVLPEVAVMQGSNLLYRGRIDDRYIDFGKERMLPTTRDLEDALMAAATGKPIAVRQTQAVGCILSDLVK